MSFFSSLLGLAPAKPHTGVILSAVDVHALIPLATLGKTNYAQIREDYILGAADRAHTALSKQGIRSWAPTATCTLFAANLAVVVAQEYYQSAFTDRAPADAPAVATFWFRPNAGPEGHAINVFATPSGLKFVDPQDPSKLRPVSPTEFATRFSAMFL